MNTAADTQVRTRALDSANSFIVRAPAGSGKTGLLIQRYLKLLAQVDAPEEVVAITFTIKAAAEMRERVLDALQLPPPGEARSGFETTTDALAVAVNKRDAELGWRIGEQPARLRIQTIDALCLSLVGQMAWTSHLGGEMRPVEDASAHYEQAAGEVFELLESRTSTWQAPISVVLRHLDNDVPRFRQMLVTMLAHRDQWLRHLWSADDGAEQMAGSLRRLIKRSLEQVTDLLPREAINQLLMVAVFGGRIEWRETFPGSDPGDLDVWLGIADALLTKTGNPRVQFSARHGFPGADHPDHAVFKESAKRVSVILAENPRLVCCLHQIRTLPSPVADERDWVLVGALVQVLKVAVGLLRVVFSERGEVDFIELIGAAASALGEPDNPTDLALSLDYRMRHILVDEFQDTSHAQIELLERLTAGWEFGDGRTVFLVGDPMQSIYRFREADVGLYLNVVTRGLGALRPEALTLTANFRSSAAVVNWVNQTFAAVLPDTEDIVTGAVSYSESQPSAHHVETGLVAVHPIFDDVGDRGASLVAALIGEELGRDGSQNIAVLVRARTHLRHILPALKTAGISYRGVDLHPLEAMPAVQDLLALTRALVYPADRVAWLAVLRAPWCGLTLADLLVLMRPDTERNVLELLAEPTVISRLSVDGQARCARVQAVLEHAFTIRGRYRLRQWVERTWLILGGPATLADAEFGETAVFFDLLDELDQQPAPDFDRLNVKVGERYSPGATGRAPVEIMTIHGAKGLEFDTVIVPCLERGARGEEKKVMEWNEWVTPEGHRELLLAPAPSTASSTRSLQPANSLYTYLRQIEGRRARNEAARLLYVAATRARKRLHLIGAVEVSKGKLKPRHDSLLAHLWPAVAGEFERVFAAARNPTQLALDMTEAPAFIRRIPTDWNNPLEEWLEHNADALPQRVVFEWAGVAAKHVGTLVHRMLNIISQRGVDAWTGAQVNARYARFSSELRALGVPEEELARAVSALTSALLTTLDDPTARWLLDPTHQDARSELAITGVIDGHLVNGILDRTFVNHDGTRWIVDYKTGRHVGARLEEFLDREQTRYERQLQQYAVLMAGLDSRPIRAGLYFPAHAEWRECRLPGLGRSVPQSGMVEIPRA